MEQVIKVGMVGLDTSHCPAFTGILNDPQHEHHIAGVRVVGAYPGGSALFSLSRSRVDGFTRQLEEEFGVRLYDSIPALVNDVDAILLESVDGRQHLEQFRQMAVGKPVYVDKPFATLDFAVGRCTASNNNIIVVLPFHAETLAGADGVDVDVSNITIIGLGYGDAVPTFTYSATGSEFVIGKAGKGATLMNLRFKPGISEVVHGIDIEASADNITLKDLQFIEGTNTAFEFDKMITLAVDANDLTIDGCRFISLDAAGTEDAIEIGDGVATRLTIKNCLFMGDFNSSCILSDQSNLGMSITNCVFYNANGGEPLLEFQGTGSTGVVAGCNFVNDGTANDMGGVMLAGNDFKTIGDDNTDGRSYSLADDGITAAKIQAAAIAASEIATDAIGAAELAADVAGMEGAIRLLLAEQKLRVGRLDGRYSSPAPNGFMESSPFDPTSAATQGPFTAVLNDYVSRELNYKTDMPYYTSARDLGTGFTWNWENIPSGFGRREGGGGFSMGYPDTATELRAAMVKDPCR
jgi:hypothetical protein